jgi:hypothetical protein
MEAEGSLHMNQVHTPNFKIHFNIILPSTLMFSHCFWFTHQNSASDSLKCILHVLLIPYFLIVILISGKCPNYEVAHRAVYANVCHIISYSQTFSSAPCSREQISQPYQTGDKITCSLSTRPCGPWPLFQFLNPIHRLPLWPCSQQFLPTDPEVPGSIPGAIRFSEN